MAPTPPAKRKFVWNEDNMLKAIKEVKENGINPYKASRKYRVPRRALLLRLKPNDKEPLRKRGSASDKCPKVWQKARRDKFKELFDELSRLLPQHDPAAPVSRMKLIQQALSYIRELQAQNEDLLNGGFDEVRNKKLESWKRQVKELVCRVEQLTGILRTANIHVPPLALETVPTWTKARPKHWTQKINIPVVKINEVIEKIAQAKRKRKNCVKRKTVKKGKNNEAVAVAVTDSGSKENLPTTGPPSKNNHGTQTEINGSKLKKGVTKVPASQSNITIPNQPKTLAAVNPQTAGILHGSVVTPIAQPNAYILTNQGNLVPVLTPNANMLTPVIINRPPPVLVVQQPPATSIPRTIPLILAQTPANKIRIQRESTVMTFANKRPISALSTHSHPRRGGKCAAHKIEDKLKITAVSPTSEFLQTFPVVGPVHGSSGSAENGLLDCVSPKKPTNDNQPCSEFPKDIPMSTKPDNCKNDGKVVEETFVASENVPECKDVTKATNTPDDIRKTHSSDEPVVALPETDKIKDVNLEASKSPLKGKGENITLVENPISVLGVVPSIAQVSSKDEKEGIAPVEQSMVNSVPKELVPSKSENIILMENIITNVPQEPVDTISTSSMTSKEAMSNSNTGNELELAAVVQPELPPGQKKVLVSVQPSTTPLIDQKKPLLSVQEPTFLQNAVVEIPSKLDSVASDSHKTAKPMPPQNKVSQTTQKASETGSSRVHVTSIPTIPPVSAQHNQFGNLIPPVTSNADLTKGSLSSIITTMPSLTTTTTLVPTPFTQAHHEGYSLTTLSTVQSSTVGSYIPPALISSAPIPPITTQQYPSSTPFPSSWSKTTQHIPPSFSSSCADVSWSPINAIRTPHFPPVATCDSSWLVPAATVSSNQTVEACKSLPPTIASSSSSWRPITNDVFFSSGGDNWSVLPPCKNNNQSAKKNKQYEKPATNSIPGSKVTIANNGDSSLTIPSSTFQWPVVTPVSDVNSSQVGLYPFSSSSNGLYSAPVPVPVSETTWQSNIPKAPSNEVIFNHTVGPTSLSNKVKTAPPSKLQCKEQSYYPPSISYLPSSSSYCPQEFHKDNFFSTFPESCPSTVPPSVSGNYTKPISKQSGNSSTPSSKTYSNISNLVSTRQQHSSTKTSIIEPTIPKQSQPPIQHRAALVTAASAPTYIPSSSKVAVTDSFYHSAHYSMADTTLYNPFPDASYTSSLLKQTLPDNFVNAYSNDTTYSSTAPYPLHVTKALLGEAPYSLSALKTPITDGYFPGVPMYSGNIPSVVATEPALNPINPPLQTVTMAKSAGSDSTQPSSATSSSHTAPQLTTSRKLSMTEKIGPAANKVGTHVNLVNNPPPNFPSAKAHGVSQSTAASFAPIPETQKPPLQSTSNCLPTSSGSNSKTSQSLPVFNSSYLTQMQTGPEGPTVWGQVEYTCVGEPKDGRPKPPINWMTDSESRTEVICPPDDPFQPRYSNSFEKKDHPQAPQTMYEYCMSSGQDDDGSKNKNRKKDVELSSQDYYGWVPMKVDPLVVSGTLPTLVGDLALGEPLPNKRSKATHLSDVYSAPRCGKDPDINTLPQEPFANLSKNIFDLNQTDNLKSASTETIVLKNIFELPAPPTGKQKTPHGQNSFLSVSQLVDSHNIENNPDKTDYSFYTPKSVKTKRHSSWKCSEKKCIQSGKGCSSYSAEALLRSQDAIQPEPDFSLPSPAAFQIDFTHDNSLMDTTDLLSVQLQAKPKTYIPRHRKQECWKNQEFRQATPLTFPPSSATQPFTSVTSKTPSEKPTETVPLPFPYLPETRLAAPPLPPCGTAPLPFPRFPTNPPAPLLPTPNFPQHKNEAIQFTGIFPSSPGRPCGQAEGALPGSRYPCPRKPYNYPRTNKSTFPPFSPPFSNEPTRKATAKPPVSASQATNPIPSAPLSVPSHIPFPPVPPQPAAPSGSSLANFNLSTIFPEINKKVNYQYP